MVIKETGLIGKQDKLLSFGETAAISGAATYPCGVTTAASDGVCLDMKVVNPLKAGEYDPANLEGFSVNFQVTTAVTGGTSGTFKVLGSDNMSDWTELAVSPAIPVAQLTEGAGVVVPVPRGSGSKRYVKAAVTIVGAATAGKVAACVDTFAGV